MSVEPENHPKNKPCTLCGTPQPVLVRCQIDDTDDWHFVCPGKCWNQVSGGVQDAKGSQGNHPHYRYGGMWKNKHAMVSAKKPKSKRPAKHVEWDSNTDFTRNDIVTFGGATYRCRRSHLSGPDCDPKSSQAYRFWTDESQDSDTTADEQMESERPAPVPDSTA